jgi:solute carrier family 25 protein 42
MIRILPYAATQFAAFEQFKKLLKVDSASNPHKRRFLAGSLAGIVSTSVTYPLDLARARMAITDKCGYK